MTIAKGADWNLKHLLARLALVNHLYASFRFSYHRPPIHAKIWLTNGHF